MAHIVIIGAGHNGLVCANYLARAGHKVTVFEQSSEVGGAARSDTTTFPGYTLSTCSYVCSLFLEKIVEDFDLRRHGYEILKREPSFFKPLPDGRFLSLGGDEAENVRQIAKFSERDAAMFPRYVEAYSVLGKYFETFLLETPPRMPPRSLSDIAQWLKVAGRTLALGPRTDARLLELFMRDTVSLLNKWFESDVVRSAMIPDATIGALDISGLVLILHSFMGEAGGGRGVWGFQRGGMGGISKALAGAAKESGVRIELNAPVESIIMSKSGCARGIQLLNGDELIAADIVVSNATPHETFAYLVPPGACPAGYEGRIMTDDYSSGVMKVNAILSGLPEFTALRGVDDPARYLKGTIHISPSTEYIETALAEVRAGTPSRAPMMELTIPSLVDNTLAPKGHHVMGMFVQYVPYYPRDGKGSWNSKRKEEYLDKNILGALRPYCSNIDEVFVGAQVLSPADLYEQFRLTGGNIFHGALSPGQLYCFRHPYRTPIKDLWLCGAGTHPGGGVMGACGHNAARDIIATLAQ